MGKFDDRLYFLRKEAKEYILDILKKRGDNYELCDPEEVDALFDMPVSTQVGDKYGVTIINQYALYCIGTQGGGEVYFEGVDREDDRERSLHIGEIETETLCEIADLIYSLENN